MAVSDFALPAALLGGLLLLREIKSIELPKLPSLPDIDLSKLQIKGTRDALIERTAKLQAYELERASAAESIGAKRAALGLLEGDYGTVSAMGMAYTGRWEAEDRADGSDSCHVVYSSSKGSNIWKSFTGPHCRQARAQGLLPPR